jgi:uncharacterized membrane protein YczE
MRALLTSRDFWIAMVRLHVGLFLFGLGVALMLEARIGLDPWSAFHDVVSSRSGLSFGRISQLVGFTLIVVSRLALGVRPGIATMLNMLQVGPWVDVLRPHVRFFEAGGLVPGTAQFLVGILVLGLGTAVYIGARLGAGPRDGLAMGLARRIGRSLRASRIGIEITVLTLAAVLGGSIGPGTILFALLMGPTMQTSLRLFSVSHDPSPTIRRDGVSPPHAGGSG